MAASSRLTWAAIFLQLDLQTRYNGSTTASARTVADQQVRLRASQPSASFNGMRTKVDELQQQLQLEKIDIYLIQETKLVPKPQ